MEPDDESDWELVSVSTAASSRTYGQLYVRIVQAHIDQPPEVNLGSLRCDVGLTKTQGVAASGSTVGVFNTNEPMWNHDFLFGITSSDAPLNISITVFFKSSTMKDPVSKFSIPLSTLQDGQVDDTWHPNDDGLLPAKIRMILCFTPFLLHELPPMPPLLNVKSLGVTVPAFFDSPQSRLLNLNLVPFQIHLDRDFLYPEETVSGILTLSARNGPVFIHTAPDICISGYEMTHLLVQNPYTGVVSHNERKSLLNERRLCHVPRLSIAAGSSFAWKFTLKLPPLLPPSFSRFGKECVSYKVRATVVLEPGGEQHTFEVEAPFRIGGPLPPPFQREKPKTHSFWFERDNEVGIKMTSGLDPPSKSVASIHISLPPGGCLGIGQENSLGIRIDAGDPLEEKNDSLKEGAIAASIANATIATAEETPASPPTLRNSGGNRSKIPEIRVTGYKLRCRGHYIRTIPNSQTNLIVPLSGAKAPVPLDSVPNVGMFDQEHSFEAMGGDINEISVPFRGGNKDFMTLLNLKDSLYPTITHDMSKLYVSLWMLHVEIKFGSHSPEAVMPVILSAPAPLGDRPAAAYPEGQRILDISFSEHLISIPVAYPTVTGDKWKVLSGTTWALQQQAQLPQPQAAEIVTLAE